MILVNIGFKYWSCYWSWYWSILIVETLWSSCGDPVGFLFRILSRSCGDPMEFLLTLLLVLILIMILVDIDQKLIVFQSSILKKHSCDWKNQVQYYWKLFAILIFSISDPQGRRRTGHLCPDPRGDDPVQVQAHRDTQEGIERIPVKDHLSSVQQGREEREAQPQC